MKILVTLKDIERRRRLGGIAHYYKALRPHLGANVSYFTIGKRENRRGVWDDLKRLGADYRRFWKLSAGADLINLNPSLGPSGLFRDGLFLVMAKLRRKKAVVFIRGWSETTAAAIDKRWARLFSLVFGRADGMIVLSGQFKEKLRDWGYRGPIWIETTTVGEKLLKYAAKEKIQRDPCNLLFLARVERDKGVYTVLGAHELLRRRSVNVRLTIVGDGSERQALRRFAARRQIPEVRFLGYLDGKKKAAAFNDAGLYVFPSIHGEGMPNSVLEAMAFGLPVVTTPVGGLPEFFEDGKMGYWLEQTDAGHLATILEKLIEDRDLRAEMSRYNAGYARRHFAAGRVAQRLEGIWECVYRATPEEKKGTTWLPDLSSVVRDGVSTQEGGKG